ncbi:MAG: DNA polymerase IV, partial [Xanthomonadales bacterium]|nr:DNA polymerase IV [Xanthomonadales bacterium]
MSNVSPARVILHVDMDAFYASVEERERPELRGRAVIVGGDPRGRGVVAAANYAARAYGVRSAMPAAQAARLCPQAVFVRQRMSLYAKVSAELHEILKRFTPQIEPLSLDEAFLDVTASTRLHGDGRHIALAIKQAVREELALVASIGVAPNKFVAKIASDLDKPDGLVVVAPEAVAAFLAPLPVARLWGAGRVAQQKLSALGIQTIGGLRSRSEAV